MEALVYDVHGNLPALEAVLDDARGIDRFVLGGDYALFGGWPRETVERLRALPNALWIRGNGERWTASPQDAPANPVVPGAIAAARAALGPQLVADLAALPDGDPRAAYAVVHDDGAVEHRRVAYDHEASAARVREAGPGWAQVVARRIERARMDV